MGRLVFVCAARLVSSSPVSVTGTPIYPRAPASAVLNSETCQQNSKAIVKVQLL